MSEQSEQRRNADAIATLQRFFARNGYVRRRNETRRDTETWQTYKKGDEVRLLAHSDTEFVELQAALAQLGFKAGAPFRKAQQTAVPLYGLKSVARFLALMEDDTMPIPSVPPTER